MKVVGDEDSDIEARWRDLPRIAGGSVRSSVGAVSPPVRRSVLGLWALAALAWGASAGAVGGPLTGLAVAAGVLAGLGALAVACQVGVLLVTRASPRRRLLADVTPAYVASLRYRPYRLQAEPAWFGGRLHRLPPAGTATAHRSWPGSSTWRPSTGACS